MSSVSSTEKTERPEPQSEPSKEPEPASVAVAETTVDEGKDLKRHSTEEEDENKRKKRKEDPAGSRSK